MTPTPALDLTTSLRGDLVQLGGKSLDNFLSRWTAQLGAQKHATAFQEPCDSQTRVENK